MERNTSYAWELEQIVADLEWGRILRYFGMTRYRLRSTGTILAQCTWHCEKTPSLVFSTRQNSFFHCFGCGHNGWRYCFILYKDATQDEQGYVHASSCEHGRLSRFFDRLYSVAGTFSDSRAGDAFVWEAGEAHFLATRDRLTKIAEDIRSAELPPHVQYPYQPRG